MSHPPFVYRHLPSCLCAVACLLGCGESKKSLHEMDHVTPAHWPSDLTDAAGKLSDRLKSLQTNALDSKLDSTATLKELSDLVGWVPEVAADTDLAESNWVRLYEASESARKKLLVSKRIEADVAHDIEKLCSLLIEAQTLIPPPVGSAGSSKVEQATELQPSE